MGTRESSVQRATITDLNEGTRITLSGRYDNDEFLVGLTNEDKLAVCHSTTGNKQHPLITTRVPRISVPLFHVSRADNPRHPYIIYSSNRDMTCYVNETALKSQQRESVLCSGSLIEIAGKLLKFDDGLKKARKLPITPGTQILPEAPRKPIRSEKMSLHDTATIHKESSLGRTERNEMVSKRSKSPKVEDEEQRQRCPGLFGCSRASQNNRSFEKPFEVLHPLIKEDVYSSLDTSSSIGDWDLVDYPDPFEQLLEKRVEVEDAHKIGQICASFILRQVMMYTDLRLSVTKMDHMFRAFQVVAEEYLDMLHHFLSDVRQCLLASDGLPRPSEQAIPGPIVRLLVNILSISLDPIQDVLLWLQLLNTFAQFSQNIEIMVNCLVTSTVLGSMVACLEHIDVQVYGMNILSKIASYKYKPCEKVSHHDLASTNSLLVWSLS